MQRFLSSNVRWIDAALWLRVGLGLVFVIGGYNKLSQLLDPAREAQFLALYLSPKGYINAFFAEYLFTGTLGAILTPWRFLTALSAFELVSGAALILGLAVRPLSLVYAFMLWSFVLALPVATAPGVDPALDTIRAPAMLVQVRDIALSCLMVVLYGLGSGRPALDARLFGERAFTRTMDNSSLGLLLRLSLALPLLVGGAFYGMVHIQTFSAPAVVLIIVALAVAAGIAPRFAGSVVALMMLWFMTQKVDVDGSFIANINGFKREFAFVAGGVALAVFRGGDRYSVPRLIDRLRTCVHGFGPLRSSARLFSATHGGRPR